MAKDRPDYGDFYWDKFASDGLVEAMTTEEVGAYMLLLCKAWRETPPATLPDDDRLLRAWTRTTPERWAELKPGVLAPFTLVNGRWAQRKLRETYDRAAQRLRSYQNRGRLGGSASAQLRHSSSTNYSLSSSSPSCQEGGAGETKPPPGFERFLSVYPDKSFPLEALGVWLDLNLEPQTEAIVKAVRQQVQAATHAKNTNGFAPQFRHPARWLESGGWMTVVANPSASAARAAEASVEQQRRHESEARLAKVSLEEQRALAAKARAQINNRKASA